MNRDEHTARRPDPWSMLTEGMRQLSRLDLADIRAGLENFTNPSAAGLLQSLGRTRPEQVEKMAAMLRNSSEAEIEEMGTVFGLAMAKLAEERAGGGEPRTLETERGRHAARAHHRQSAAERRQARRLSS
jgi:hypothetical protein